MNYWVVIIIALVLVLIAVVIYYKHIIAKFSRKLDKTLDDMISEKDVDFEYQDESISGKLNVKLKRLYEILNDRTEMTKKDRDNMQSLISDITHQVRTPTANLKMYNQILTERELTDEQRKEFIELSENQIDKLDFLMNSLVKMSRLENGMIKLNPQKILVLDILSDGLLQIMLNAEKKNINIDVDCDESICAVCDKKWTSEVVFNILDNAVKYTPQNGKVFLSVSEQEFYTVVSIKDNGAGIAEQEQPLIFKRFYRSATASDEKGAGIGLFLSRELITAQDGYIQVRSEVGKGSEFLIFLKK